MNKQLKLQWITDVIKEDYRNWNTGDTVTIESQTNTGKTTFIINELIHNMEDHEKMLYICNRKELKRQIKIELLRRFDLPIPETIEELDKTYEIKNIRIISYQSIEEGIMQQMYQSKTYIMNTYKYIVCDECHFFLTDAVFNTKTHLSFKDLILTHYEYSIKILISATMDELINVIERTAKGKLHKYTTGRDYSYLNVSYFKYYKDISQMIINDTTNDKWIVFVANKKKGNELKSILKRNNVKTVFITSESKDKERENISRNSYFESKVLITTKCMDNGISIKDDAVKHIVITAYDKTTFIQEVGRVRIDIENARPINLYIDTLYKKSFSYKLNLLEEKRKDTELYSNKYNEFKMKYDHNVSSVPEDLFYLDDNEEKKWQCNMMGHCRLAKDYNFYYDMIDDFKNKGEFAYICKQLEWLGLKSTFNINNLITDTLDNKGANSVKEFLKEAYENDIKFDKDEFIYQIENIIKNKTGNNLDELLNKLDGGNKREKGMKQYNKLFRLLELPYIVGSKRFKIENKKVTKWIIIKE